jgi:hypothetical protein
MAFMRAEDILEELQGMGSESYKRMLVNNHGVREPCLGVKIGDLKKISTTLAITTRCIWPA